MGQKSKNNSTVNPCNFSNKLTVNTELHIESNMPTYDYVCTTCGITFEHFQSIKSDPITQCPEGICTQEQKGKGNVQRKISSGSGLVFNGSGFYLTDYVQNKSSSTTTSNDTSSSAS